MMLGEKGWDKRRSMSCIKGRHFFFYIEPFSNFVEYRPTRLYRQLLFIALRSEGAREIYR